MFAERGRVRDGSERPAYLSGFQHLTSADSLRANHIVRIPLVRADLSTVDSQSRTSDD